MAIHCAAAERGVLVKKRKRKFNGKTYGLSTYRSDGLKSEFIGYGQSPGRQRFCCDPRTQMRFS